MPRKPRKQGVSTRPTQVRIFPGQREKSSAAVKKTRVKSSRKSRVFPAGRTCSSPTVKEVVAQRGMAKKGPMVRYRAQVKNME